MRLIDGKAPFGQLNACDTVNTFPHRQCEGSLSGVHPNLKHRASLKACLCSPKPYLVIVMAVSHVDAPLSLHRVVIPGNLYFGRKVWITSGYIAPFRRYVSDVTSDVTGDVTVVMSCASQHTINSLYYDCVV